MGRNKQKSYFTDEALSIVLNKFSALKTKRLCSKSIMSPYIELFCISSSTRSVHRSYLSFRITVLSDCYWYMATTHINVLCWLLILEIVGTMIFNFFAAQCSYQCLSEPYPHLKHLICKLCHIGNSAQTIVCTGFNFVF